MAKKSEHIPYFLPPCESICFLYLIVPFQNACSLLIFFSILECSFSFLSEFRARFTAFLFILAMTIVLWNSNILRRDDKDPKMDDPFRWGDLPPSRLCSNHHSPVAEFTIIPLYHSLLHARHLKCLILSNLSTQPKPWRLAVSGGLSPASCVSNSLVLLWCPTCQTPTLKTPHSASSDFSQASWLQSQAFPICFQGYLC